MGSQKVKHPRHPSLKPSFPFKYQWPLRRYCAAFVSSWSGVVKYHGLCPKRKAGQIFVANHTSMIDMIILEQVVPHPQLLCHSLHSRNSNSSVTSTVLHSSQFRTFAVVGQKHTGWVGLMQDRYLQALGSVWFDRTSGKSPPIVNANN
jgi:glycerol-3-phosphate O-acyltransferase 3/4